MKKTLVLALAAIMVLGVAGAAFAGSDTFCDTTLKGTTDPATVTVNAKVNPKITLTVTTTDGSGTDLLLDWATTPLDVGDDPNAKTVDLVVESNKDYTLSRDSSDMTDLAPLNIVYKLDGSEVASVSGTHPGGTHEDSVDPGVIDFNVPADTLLEGTLVYTALQQ